MESKEIRQKLLEIFGSQIKFNKNFDDYILKLKEGMLNDFIDIILDNHKVYDNTRLKLGYKKSSYYGS